TTHQQDTFRKAATDYGNKLQAAVPAEEPAIPRLGIAVVGQGAASSDYPLFRKLRPHGAFYTNVNPEGGLRTLLDFATSRSTAYPVPYGHWYIDGGRAAAADAALTRVSYGELEPARNALLAKMQKQSEMPGGGPENLRTVMAALRPSDLRIE